MRRSFLFIVPLIAIASCNSDRIHTDASGTFEANEVIVSAELPGRLLSLNIDEGSVLQKDSIVGTIDSTNLILQKEQVAASIDALAQRTTDVSPQIKLLNDQLAVQLTQLGTMEKERTRTENLLKADAATGKQLDDIQSQIDVLTRQIEVTRQQINVQRSNISTQNRGILSENAPLKKRIAQLDEQLSKSSIVNPVAGTVLTKYAEAGEVVTTGKPLYKIADLRFLHLRAYVPGSLLPQLQLGQEVTVLTDQGAGYKSYAGTIIQIADKAEFTPKTIQTKEERANLVYAVKIRVKNDGYLKIGMYAEVQLNAKK